MMTMISSRVKYSYWPDMSINRTQNTVKSHYSWGTNDWYENVGPGP